MSVQDACSGPLAPDVVGEIRAYRSFRVMDDGRSLGSLNYGTRWMTHLDARCHAHGVHAAPDPDCKCGIYAWYRPSAVPATPAPVLAAVAVSGRMLMGTHGLRAQRARIVAVAPSDTVTDTRGNLWATGPSAELRKGQLASIAHRIGVQHFSSPAALISGFPPDDLSTLVGDVPEGPPPPSFGFTAALAGGGIVGGIVAKTMHQAMMTVAQQVDQRIQQIITYSATPVITKDDALKMLGLPPDPPADETPKQRALRLRRHRNTGPGGPRMDGRRG